jgi:hypothetical protein
MHDLAVRGGTTVDGSGRERLDAAVTVCLPIFEDGERTGAVPGRRVRGPRSC